MSHLIITTMKKKKKGLLFKELKLTITIVEKFRSFLDALHLCPPEFKKKQTKLEKWGPWSDFQIITQEIVRKKSVIGGVWPRSKVKNLNEED